MRTPRLFTIILHFGDPALTRACLQALAACDARDWRQTVVVVDNAADGGFAAGVPPDLYDVLLEPGRNLGFAAGVNEGIAHARQNRADYVLLLNNDLVVDAGALTALAQAVRVWPARGLYGGKIFYAHTRNRIWFAGGAIHKWLGRTRHLGFRRAEAAKYNRARTVDFLTGAFLLIDRRAFDKTGLFDASLFLYYEDSDFSIRARRQGFSPTYIPQAVAWHDVGAEGATGLTPRYLYYQTRNRPYVLGQCGGRIYRVYLFILNLLIYGVFRSVLLFVRRGPASIESLRAVRQGLRDSWKNNRGPRQERQAT